MLFATQLVRESSRQFQPEPADIDFFNPDYFNLKGFGGAYHINKRGAPIYILFFRIFWKV